MKPIHMQQEILLFINTSFAHQEFAGRKNEESNKPTGSVIDKLEEACWNGLLPDILPELASDSIWVHHLHLWRIKLGNSFLCIDLAEQQVRDYSRFSLNPALFLDSVNNC